MTTIQPNFVVQYCIQMLWSVAVYTNTVYTDIYHKIVKKSIAVYTKLDR